MWLLLPFVILPIVEIALFIQVGGAIGLLPTIALVLLSAVLGASVMRRQGMVAMLDVQRAMQEFRDPAAPMAHGALIMVAGVLLIVPGLFTSALGLLLLVPAVRAGAMRALGRHVRVTGAGFSTRRSEDDFAGDFPAGYRSGPRGDRVVDGEYSVQDDPPTPVRDGLTDARPKGPGKPGNSGWTRH